MPAITGAEFLARRAHLTSDPAFGNVLRSYAALYDMQHDPAYRDVLTYPSPSSGEPVAASFLIPRTPADLAQRRNAFELWAGRSHGMLGRTGDYLNSALMALASAHTFFGPSLGANVLRYYEMVREQDLLCTTR
jgi:4-hydroxyphenylacetate 3-monooxygenase